MKKVLRYGLVIFYILAGLNHFIQPEFYKSLVPDYFPYPELIITVTGILEMALGILVIFSPTRRLAAIGIIILLVTFIPAHIYFIIMGSCIEDGPCFPIWTSWVRLLLIHPLLIYWAWVVRRS